MSRIRFQTEEKGREAQLFSLLSFVGKVPGGRALPIRGIREIRG
jgi:hypothetical protein